MEPDLCTLILLLLLILLLTPQQVLSLEIPDTLAEEGGAGGKSLDPTRSANQGAPLPSMHVTHTGPIICSPRILQHLGHWLNCPASCLSLACQCCGLSHL